jgi:hypothetical protein
MPLPPPPGGGEHSPAVLARWADYQRRNVRELLNERYVLVKKVEREGFRRVLGAVVLFIGYKFVRHRFMGAGDSGQGGL